MPLHPLRAVARAAPGRVLSGGVHRRDSEIGGGRFLDVPLFAGLQRQPVG